MCSEVFFDCISLEMVRRRAGVTDEELWQLIKACWNLAPIRPEPTFCKECGVFVGLEDILEDVLCQECKSKEKVLNAHPR